ncbi:isoleucine--tRNA ligase [Candidatus Woesearchaeota archaeon]|jgi:isoleucyl-tRNA synthetase|nr:isoleucine--tRNA ligase [Candidatus Woesearchaeota archaeon]MBT5739862.1 isoleucine--tRNA ligase [Candidatus Woesearchaeota archaeon]
MKYPTYDHETLEPQILTYWQTNKILEQLREKNKNGKKFYFLQGPPYTSGKVHVGTAWNICLKDMVLRHQRLLGKNLWDRMGYDMHGLPTSQKVMKKFSLKNKDEIEIFGVKKFTDECKNFCLEMMHQMNKDFIRLGSTFDHTDPYQPISKEFIQGLWFLIKTAHEKGRLYEGQRTMHWDAATQSAVAKHELEYKSVTDTSIYMKFPHKDKPNTFFVIWTTTPWTIPLNLAIMVNPTLDYVDVKVGDETWILAKELAGKLVDDVLEGKMQVTKEYKGEELVGQHYSHPLNIKECLPEDLQNNPKLFSILSSEEYVTTEAGTGLVHCAPGCGPEDYEVGHDNKIPPFNCVNEEGYFKEFGKFTDYKAKIDDNKFIEAIEDSGTLVAKEKYVHDYPHGERSHQPVIFRTTKQWFFKVEDLKEKMLVENEKVLWNPITAKNAFHSWLQNLRDNSITKQRYWGTPIPIWQAEDGDYIVVGSVAELEELSGQKVTNLHIPSIDEITIEKDGKVYKRCPDILDVWVDAGSASWNSLYYPQRTDLFEKFFPADAILEGKDQIRGWFNLLMVCSFLAFDKAPFKRVFMHGFLNDIDGVKMSKSLGNIISPKEFIQKHGADVFRYYMCQTRAGVDINFSWDECVVKQRNLHILWNMHKLVLNIAKEIEVNPAELNISEDRLGVEEQYIFSKLHSTVQEVSKLLEEYKLDEIIAPIENLFLELSRTYMQLVREKSSVGEQEDKEVVLYTVYTVLLSTIKMFQIISPFICEAIYLNFKETFSLKEASVSHYTWPEVNKELIDTQLEKEMASAKQVIQAILHAREQAKLGVRWPVKEVVVITQDAEPFTLLQDAIKQQTNVKSLQFKQKFEGVKLTIKPEYAKIGPVYGNLSPQIITQLGIDSPETVVQHIESDGAHIFDINKQTIKITKEMVNITRSAPDGFTGANWKQGAVYLNIERTSELDAEGYAREIMRKVQDLRKKTELEKTDRINLVVQCTDELKQSFKQFQEMMQEKVGAPTLHFTTTTPQKQYDHTSEFKIKDILFTVWFSKT